jgi:hypothetical protein
MSDVYYLRPIVPPIAPDDVYEWAQHSGGCFDLHRVDWAHSFLSADGGRMLCWYRAPDAESVRLALRQLGSDMNAVWPCRVIGNDDVDKPEVTNVNVVAEVSSAEPLDEDDGGWLRRFELLNETGVCFVLGFLSASKTRLVCLLQAADADTVGSALKAVNLPSDTIWPCTLVTPNLR